MFSDETREFVFIGISLALISSIISFALYLVSLRDDIAMAENTSVAMTSKSAELSKYASFMNKEVGGIDVVCAISDLYDSGITIRVDKKTGGTYLVDRVSAKGTPALIDLDTLNLTFPSNTIYKAVCIYDSTDVRSVSSSYTPSSTSGIITGIAFFYVRTN